MPPSFCTLSTAPPWAHEIRESSVLVIRWALCVLGAEEEELLAQQLFAEHLLC